MDSTMTTPLNATRRRVLTGSAGVIASLSALPLAQAQSQPPSVTFENQGTAGASVTITEIITDEPVYFRLSDENGDTTYVDGQLDRNQQLNNFTLDLDTPIAENGRYWFSLFPTGGGSSIAKDSAWIVVSEDGEVTEGMPIQEVEATPEEGFNYPYFVYVPMTPGSWDESTPLLVQQNNSPNSADDLDYHKEYARKAMESGAARQISDRLGLPLLIPIIPKSESEPVDWRYRTQALDRDSLTITKGPLRRVDLQVKEMIEHGQNLLADEGYPVRKKVILNGYSGSGKFAQRFTMLHPQTVLSVSAGGLAGMPVLPREEAKGQTLNYHVGIADVEELTGKSVDISAVADVNQFLFEGGNDTRDTIGHDDAWTSEELEQVALDVYGEDTINRFRYSESVFADQGLQATFKVYEDAGHTPRPAINDIIEFHSQFLNGDDPKFTSTTVDTEEHTSIHSSETMESETESTSQGLTDTSSTKTQTPGFGIPLSIASLSGLAYWLKKK